MTSTTSNQGITVGGESTVMHRIEAEYVEMPGLRLTLPQAARLWGLDIRQSTRLLSELVSTGFLVRDSTGAYRRRGCPRCA
jgi:Fic family protein